jgi:hypothetical protein
MKLWFHSAPLWKMDKLLDLRCEPTYKKMIPILKKKDTHNIYVSFLFEYIQFKTTRFLDDPSRRSRF